MEKGCQMRLTPADKCILESYKTMVEGLSDYLGSGYEIVLHSLENLDQSVIRILNGHHTGRKEGAPITDLALEMLEQLDGENHPPYITYPSRNKKGEPIKSSTIAIRGENNRIIGLVCMNFYLNIPLSTFITESYLVDPVATQTETFAENTEEVIEKTVLQIRKEVLGDNLVPANNKNRIIIAQLAKRGVFNLKDAVPVVAKLLDISKNTVYLHLRHCNGNNI